MKLGPPAAGEKRVVFMGDSITQGWHLDEPFPGKPYVNRGISGQTTPQMLVRFWQDVIAPPESTPQRNWHREAGPRAGYRRPCGTDG